MRSHASIFALAANLAIAQSQVTINPSTTYQTMDGFGFSEAFGFGGGVQNAPAAQQTQALDLLFSTTTGAGFSILRNRIAADPGNTIEPNAPSSPAGSPTYRFDGNDQSQVFWSKAARARGVKYIYADAWSAPGYMKTTGSYENGGYLCGVTGETCSSGDWRQAYANYLVQYIKDYASVGVTIDFIGFLNEPEFPANYDAMLSDGTKAASFITVLHSTIAAAGLSTQINCCDAEGWKDQVTYTSQLIAAGVEPLLGRITSHFYTSQGSSPISTNLRVWETEYADLNDAFSTVWYSSGAMNEGFYWAKLLYQGVVGANLSGFLYWIGAQSNSNAAALITLTGSGSGTVVTPSASLWAFAMWSRFIRPDAVRIGVSGAPSGVEIAAFKNTNGNIVVVLTNTGSSSTSVTVGGTGASSVSGYVMSNSVSQPTSFSSTLSGGSISASLPGHSVVTFVITTEGTGASSSSVTSSSTTLKTSTTTTSSVTKGTTSTTSSSAPAGSGAIEYAQCGGIGWTGTTVCASPYTCTFVNPYYSQCL